MCITGNSTTSTMKVYEKGKKRRKKDQYLCCDYYESDQQRTCIV